MKTILLLSSLSLLTFSAHASCKGGVDSQFTAIEFASPIPAAYANEFVASDRNHMRFELTRNADSESKTEVSFTFFGKGVVPKLIKDEYSGKLVPTAFYDVNVADITLDCEKGVCQGEGIEINLRKSTLKITSKNNAIAEATNGFSPSKDVKGWKTKILVCPQN